MAILLGIDLETTGLNPETDQIIEVGCILWDTSTHVLLNTYSTLIKGHSIPNEITDLTGITQESFEYGKDLQKIITSLNTAISQADYLVAHNAEFEKSFLKPYFFNFDSMKWIDTKTDIPYKPGKGNGTLSEIAMSHGVFNPMPHRALTDTLAMMQVLAQYPFEEVERYAKAQNVQLIVTFPFDETRKKQAAVKALGFYWEPGSKQWRKPCKDFLAEAQASQIRAAGLNVQIIKDVAF